MGKELEVTYHHGVVTLMIDPFAIYRAELNKNDGSEFLILKEIENPEEDNERDTGRTVGFEIENIFSITADDIPELEDLYDIEEIGFKDLTIKEIVLLLQRKAKEEQESQHRKTA
jgi:hypothetical protein